MSAPWYRDGLRFTCTQCGDCCTGAPGYVWVDEAELQALADHLGEPVKVLRLTATKKGARGLSLREKLNGDCIFLDEQRRCTVYPVRPRQCRTWPFWESNLETPEDWQETCRVCPGSGQGELISADEILARVKVIRI